MSELFFLFILVVSVLASFGAVFLMMCAMEWSDERKKKKAQELDAHIRVLMHNYSWDFMEEMECRVKKLEENK